MADTRTQITALRGWRYTPSPETVNLALEVYITDIANGQTAYKAMAHALMVIERPKGEGANV